MAKGKSIGIISIKGGVGKTTTVVNLANILANDHGKKVLAVDANFSSPNLALHLGNVKHKKGLNDLLNNNAKLSEVIYEHDLGFHFIPHSLNEIPSASAQNKLKDHINGLKNHYDYIIIDSSPSLNSEMLSALNASDELYVVSTPDIPTLTTTIKALQVARDNKSKVHGMILNKVTGKSYELKAVDMERLSGIPVIGIVKNNVRVLDALNKVQPISKLNPHSETSLEFKRVASLIANVEFKEPSIVTKVKGYLRDDFSNLKTHDFAKGLGYFK